MFLLAYRNLRARPARTLLTALAIALGVGMIFAMRIVGIALEDSAGQARASRLAGADLEVSGAASAYLEDTLADKLAAWPEVEFAAPTYRALEGAPASRESLGTSTSVLGPGLGLRGTGLTLLGVDPARAPGYELDAGSFFTDLSGASRDPAGLVWEVILPTAWAAQHGISVGDPIELTTGNQSHTYSVVGLRQEQDTLTSQPTAWLPIQTMQATFDTPGAATSIFVWLKPGILPDPARDSLQDALGSQYIVAGASGASGSASFFGTLVQLSLPFSSLAVLLTGSFLVYNAFAISLAERRREISQLRTLGMTRGQALQQTLAEALLVALVGSVVGLLLGFGLGRGLVVVFVGLLQNQPIPSVAVPLDGALLALGAGVLITLAVTLNLARAASRVNPLEALRLDVASAEKQGWYMRRGWIGALASAVVCAIGLAVALNMMESGNGETGFALSFLPTFALASLTLFALPLGVRGALWLFGRIAVQWGAPLRLAVRNMARRPTRAALTAATVTLGLMLIVALSGLTLVANESAKGPFVSLFEPDFLLVRNLPGGLTFDQLAALPNFPPLSPALQADLDALKTEAEVWSLAFIHLPGYSTTGLDIGFAASLDIFRDNPNFIIIEGTWDEADRYFASGPALTLPEIAARRYNLHPGDMVELDTLEGKTPFTVALVGGAIPLITPEAGAKYLRSYPSVIPVTARAGVSKDELQSRLEEIARRHDLAIAPDAAEFSQATLDNLFNTTLALFAGLTSLSSLIAALGIVNTLVASVLERQREIGTLRALGMSRAQVRALIVAEAGILGLTGAVMGVLGGLAITWAFGALAVTFSREYGISNFEAPMPWAIAGLALVVGPAIAMLAALWPADRAANVIPAEAMRAEGATGFLKPAAHLGPTGLRGLVARMPLSAKLSFVIGVVFVLTIAALTAARVNYERQLLEDNTKSLMARQLDFMAATNREQFGAPEVDELSPQTLALLLQNAGVQLESVQTQFQGGNSPYEFGLKYFLIVNAEDKVVFTDKAELNGRVITDTVTLTSSSSIVRLTGWTGERVFEGITPLENEAGKRLGTAYIGVSTEPIDNLIRDIVVSSSWTMIAALAVTVTLTILFTRRALAPVAQIAEASYAVARGDLNQRIPETGWDELGSLSRSFNDMVKGLNERERMRDLFGRYLSREVSEAVLAGRVTLRGERKTITCLYCDMRGSTAFAEQHAPEEVMEALNQYFEVIVLSVEAHGGIVNRFVGDEAVCIFGAPTSYRDHAERALQAALSMREGLAYLNQKRTTLNLPTLKFGIGLNTGEVVAGATGSEERQEYTVIGDAMNLGARIQALNKEFPDHDILLSEFTVAALGPGAERYNFVDLGPVEIRGKSLPVRVFGLT